MEKYSSRPMGKNALVFGPTKLGLRLDLLVPNVFSETSYPKGRSVCATHDMSPS